MIAGYACCYCGQEAQVPMRSRCRHVCCWICWLKVFEVSFCTLSSLLLSWVLDLGCRHWRAEVIMVALCNRADHYIFMLWFVLLLSSFMVALWNRADHIYFHAVVCSSSSFFISSPNLSRRRLDVCHTSTHGVALVRI